MIRFLTRIYDQARYMIYKKLIAAYEIREAVLSPP
jgi:hypothetical protein